MTKETAEAINALLKGIAFAMFFIVGLGGILIANSFVMVWVSLVVVAICWIAINVINEFSTYWEDKHFND
jgi:hypothetical protein